MATATGDVVETPTQQFPYKAVIRLDGEIVNEEFFPNRTAAEEFIIIAVQRPDQLERKGGRLR